MKVRLSPRATRDLKTISAYIHERNPRAARELREILHASMQIISIHPDIGRLQRLRIRRYSVPQTPYLIFYRPDVRAQIVNIVTIRHAARRPSDLSV